MFVCTLRPLLTRAESTWSRANQEDLFCASRLLYTLMFSHFGASLHQEGGGYPTWEGTLDIYTVRVTVECWCDDVVLHWPRGWRLSDFRRYSRYSYCQGYSWVLVWWRCITLTDVWSIWLSFWKCRISSLTSKWFLAFVLTCINAENTDWHR